ncbi:MAG: cell division protein FtsZ [Deltaproteobacteria bacterium]|jgi:cell division protein FtsZ|nr:cell division protein FtsZ [Deltaproteobacteria bacterium]
MSFKDSFSSKVVGSTVVNVPVEINDDKVLSLTDKIETFGAEDENRISADFEPIGARIKVIGVGGGGNNAINNMVNSGLTGVEFITANTDAQALKSSLADIKVQLGNKITKGLGAGANPIVGEEAAKESIEELKKALTGADMVFVTAGMGGGTGSGGAPIIAAAAKELGALTVGVVTKPFVFEGKRRMSNAEAGIGLLAKEVDTLITIPNQKLLSISGKNTGLLDTFKKADDVLHQAVRGISDLILNEGLINVDFADVKAVMSEMGLAMMGVAEGHGENRAIDAAQKAISSPLLEDVSIKGARGILLNVTAGRDVTLQEISEAAELIHSEAHEDANIIWGMVIDPNLQDTVQVTVIATGFGDGMNKMTSFPDAVCNALVAPVVNLPISAKPAEVIAPNTDDVSPVFNKTISASSVSSAQQKTIEKKLDIPTILRTQKEEDDKLRKIASENSVQITPFLVEDEGKYEIPTFLRRHSDK